MPMPKHPEPLVAKTVQLAERQVVELERKRQRDGRASLSFYVREALDHFLGLDKATIDPRTTEQERVA